MTVESPTELAVIPSRELAVLTATKTVANTALRWVGPFLPTLERAFSTSIGTLTSVLALAELAGLNTAPTGRIMDRGHQRRIFIAGLWTVAVASVVALAGTVLWFAVAATILMVGVSNLTVAGHAWISARVPYGSRGRAIGTFELSWALALLVGAPAVAVLIEVAGWRGPFVGLAIAAAAAALLVTVAVPPVPRTAGPTGDRDTDRRLPRSVWPPLLASACCGASGLAVFVIAGAWLGDRHGVTTGGLGLVAMGFGALELVASGSSAAWADRLGKRRSVVLGIVIQIAGALVTGSSGDSLVLAVVGLTLFLAGFEFAFVTSLSLVSEAAPRARGRALGLGNGLGTLMRSGAVFASGQLYESVGVGGSLGVALALAGASMALIVASARPDSSSTAAAT